jgi:hypothetical protein
MCPPAKKWNKAELRSYRDCIRFIAARSGQVLPGLGLHASIPATMTLRWLILPLLLLLGCASGPHPALEYAAKDLKCPVKDLKRTEIYPNKQRVEGCNKEGVYVKTCGEGYGIDAECRWARAKVEEY